MIPQQYVNQQPNVNPQPAPLVKIEGNHLFNPDPTINEYNLKGYTLIPAVSPINPNLKEMVGTFIYDYVEKFVGESFAPKVTGMLIDMPLNDIKEYLYDFTKLY